MALIVSDGQQRDSSIQVITFFDGGSETKFWESGQSSRGPELEEECSGLASGPWMWRGWKL